MIPIFITGIGTDVGKTLVAAILAEALEADYWKPVQAGYENGTDSEWVKQVVSNSSTRVHLETYKLRLAASPHIAAREENTTIHLDEIARDFERIRQPDRRLIIEGAGGLLVPLNENELVIDLIRRLEVTVILISRNYLGSINHSLLTAQACLSNRIPVAGWIFNDQYLNYEQEIARWSGIPRIGSIPWLERPGRESIAIQARAMAVALRKIL